jgi:alkaline phosphatase D
MERLAMKVTRKFWSSLLRRETIGPAWPGPAAVRRHDVRRLRYCRCSMKISFAAFALPVVVQIMTAGLALGQVMTHGPVVGGVTASKANVFVRTDQATSVLLRYGTNSNLNNHMVSEMFTTDATSDFTKVIPLADLSAETTYYLNVVVNGVSQLTPPYPSFATFPSGASSRSFSFVVLTDFTTTGKLASSVQTFASAAATKPVFAFLGGDFDHRDPLTLLDKRQMFKDLYDANTPFMGDFVNLILRRTPIIHQWDDHDSGVNNIDKNYLDWNLNKLVFQEYVPSYPLPLIIPGIWQKFSYAQADFFVLDCRSQRDPETDPDDANKSMLDGNNLGATGELYWLEHGLLRSPARWKIIFTSVITNPTTKFPDGWAGYQTEWNALKDFINTNNIEGVVFISGDLHLGAIDNGRAAGFPEMCVAQPNSIQVGNRCATARVGQWSEGFYNDTCSGFGLVTILKNPDRLTLQMADEFGTLHISYTVSAPASIKAQPVDKTVRAGKHRPATVLSSG